MYRYLVCAATLVIAISGSALGGGVGYGHFDGYAGLGGYASNEIAGSYGGHDDHEKYIDYHVRPSYHYDYAVHDLHTHDIKSQWETRDGDKVEGEYTLLEPDGSKRIVRYSADKHTGFNAIVKNIKHGY
ncbi:cuticle protein 19-like [Agrilus planipennis]|uniref:Cuticle protein 19-like n=1 Tax=Agrilus planipennis TaxID=224129 RepID=A0A1W4XJK4_AGRPL|nr:cuticle protein 19-like [Agrilus planipennis]